MSDVEVTLSHVYDVVRWRLDPENDNPMLARRSAQGVAGETVKMPSSEKERLGKLGAIEGVDPDEEYAVAPLAAAGAVLTPAGGDPDKPTLEGRPGAQQFAGTPLDREIDLDPTVGPAAGDERVETKDLPLSDLLVRNGTLYAEADRLGISVDDDTTASDLKAKVSEARQKEAASSSDDDS